MIWHRWLYKIKNRRTKVMSGAEEIRKRLENLRLVMAVHDAQW